MILIKNKILFNILNTFHHRNLKALHVTETGVD